MIDGHVHLENGPLSVDYVLEFIQEAINKGVDELQILDHTHRFIEFKDIYKNLYGYDVQEKWLENKFKDQLSDYITLINEVKKKDLPIRVTFGLEVCYVPEYEEKIKEILKDYSFDFLVGAIHSIDGILYDMPFSKELLWNKYEIDSIYKRYYEIAFHLIQSHMFTQLAHIDTIKLYQFYPTYNLIPTYKRLAHLLKENHMKVENNVGCYYRYHHKDLGLSDELIKIFKQEGVEIITATDAHYPKDVGLYIKEAEERINNIVSKN